MFLLNEPPAVLVRRGLLALAGLTTLGIAVELAVERHWTQPVQLVAWGAVLALVASITLVAWAPSRTRLAVARILAAAVVLSALVGIGEHVYANYDSGELDRRYSATWDTLPKWTQWALALTKTVGPASPFAPGALAEAALAVVLATVGHPALRRDGDRYRPAPRRPDG